MDCTFEAEKSFGPAVTACRRAFDFTLFFEEIFFKLLPSALFLVAATLRVAVLARNKRRVRFGLLYYAKIVRNSVRKGGLGWGWLLLLSCTREKDRKKKIKIILVTTELGPLTRVVLSHRP